MRDQHNTNTGEGASLSRRTFMSLTASGAAMTLPTCGLAQVPEQASVDVSPPPSPLLDLIQQYAAVRDSVEALYERAAELEDCEALTSLPRRRVRYSWLVRGWIDDETGERARDPLYAYSEREIEEVCEKELDNRLFLMPPSPSKAQLKAVYKWMDEKRARLKAELSKLELAYTEEANRVGLTLALQSAKNAGQECERLSQMICDYKPLSLYEGALLARWALDVDPCNDNEDLFIGVMRSIAGAGNLATGITPAAQRVFDRT